MALAFKVVLLLAFVSAAARGEPARVVPLVVPLAKGVGEGAVLALPLNPNTAGAYALDSAGLRWVGKSRLSGPQSIDGQLSGRPVAACCLANNLLVVVLLADEVASIAVLQAKTPDAFSVVQTAPLPDTHARLTWAVTADQQRLFVAAGGAIYRSLYTAGGVSKPKLYATLDAPVRSMAFGRKGYLAVLTRDDQPGSSELLFLNPLANAGAKPLARFDLPLEGASAIAYSAATSALDWPLYAAARDGVYRIETQLGPNGAPTAAGVLIHETEQPVRTLLGVGVASKPRDEAGALMMLVGDKLLALSPPNP